MKKASSFDIGLIWFGAAMSIAEIMTGTYLAPLGIAKGTLAILLGHLIGFFLLFASGVIGGKSKTGSMETSKKGFGKQGGRFFAVLNILQLVGWTGIMIYDGADAAREILPSNKYIWMIIIGAMISLWVILGVKNLGKLNSVVMLALFIMTIIMFVSLCQKGFVSNTAATAMSFGVGVELSVTMPLSWLPLISDYTKEAKKPVRASFVAAIFYCIASAWMYFIGMWAAINTGADLVSTIILKSGLGIAGLFVVILSTTVTTFLDAYSSAESLGAIFSKINKKLVGVVVAVIGTVSAICFPMDNITDFLYVIGSVFAPMIAVLLANHFVVKNDYSKKQLAICNLFIWLVGFIIYRIIINADFIVGCTLPDMLITFVLAVVVGKITKAGHKANRE